MNAVIVLLPWTAVLVLLLELPGLGTAGLLTGLLAAVIWGLSHVGALRIWLSPVALPAGWLALVLTGWQVASWAQARFDPWPLQPGETWTLEGRIDGLPEQDRFGVKLRVRLDCASRTEGRCDQYRQRHPFWPVLVEIRGPHAKWPQPPLPGQRWRFVTQPQPEAAQDPLDTFNLARWLRANHVVARFRLGRQDNALQLEEETAPLQMARLALRQAVAAYQDRTDSGPGLSGLPVVLALITGDRALMTPEHWRIFNNTGTTHLIAISGSHIMLVTAVVILLLHALIRRWLWLTRWMPGLNLSLLLGWLVALGYGGLAGLEFPVQRALIMLTIVVLFKAWGRAQPLWLAWNMAFCLVLLWDPMAAFSLGFWLSFLAVYWILWVSAGTAQRPDKWALWLRVQWGIFAGLAPVLLWQLQSLSLVSAGTNVFAIPLIGMVLTPLALLWALCWSLLGDLATPLLWLANRLAELSIWLLQWCADTPVSLFTTTPHPASAMLLALLGVIWLGTAGLPGRWLAPVLLLPLLLPARLPDAVTVRADAAAPRLLVNTRSTLLHVGQSEWPRLDNRWLQNWLRFQGVAVPGPDVQISNGAAGWQAHQWTLTLYQLDENWLGVRRVIRQSFDDLCDQDSGTREQLHWQVMQRNTRGTQCTVLLERQGQRWLLLSPHSLKDQAELLHRLQQLPAAPHWVLSHHRQQDRWLPALLRHWQQQGTRLLSTGPLTDGAMAAMAAAGLTPRILPESQRFELVPDSS